jgi:hypothetical protein
MVAVIVVSPRDQILGMLAFTAVGAVLYLVKAGLVRRRGVATIS